MSSACHHASWCPSSYRASYRIINEKAICVFSPKETALLSLQITCFSLLVHEVVKRIKAAAGITIKQEKCCAFFVIDTPTQVEDAVRSFFQIYKDKRFGEKAGASSREYVESLNIAKEKINQYFAENGEPSFHVSYTPQLIEEEGDELFAKLIKEGYSQFGLTCSDSPVSFTEEDITIFEVVEKEVSPAKMNCFQSALLQTKDPAAADLIFQKPSKSTCITQAIGHLTALGYRSVEAPNEGDLVVYFDGLSSEHMGYFTESGQVLSKFGEKSPVYHMHALFSVPLWIEVAFFRKSKATGF